MKKYVMSFLSVVTVLAIFVTLVFVGCKTTTTETTTAVAESETTTVAETTSAEGPVPGGILRVAYESEPLTLDPHLCGSNMDRMLAAIPNDFLWVSNKERTGMLPMLAKEWSWIDDLTLEIKLREGVLFSNGRELTSEDVKFNIERLQDPSTGAVYAGNYSTLTEVEIVDNYTVKFHFSEFTPGIIYSLSQDPIVAKEAVEDGSLAIGPSIGCGAFIFKRWDKGLRLVFEKNPNYWDPGKPYLDGLEIVYMQEYTTRRQALMAGDIDVIFWAENADLDSLSQQPGVKVNDQGFLDVADYIAINTSSPLMSNVKLRQAMKFAINKTELNELFNKGLTEDISAPMYHSDPFYSLEWDWQQDIEKAKALIAEIYPDGMTDKVLILGSPVQRPLEELVSGQLQAAGIPSELEIIDNSAYVDRVINRSDWDIGTIGDFFDIGNPLFWYEKYYVPGAALGGIIGKWQNQEVIDLIADYKKPHTIEERIEITDQIYRIVNEEVPQIWQGIELKAGAFKYYVHGYFQNGGGYIFYQDVWMDKQ